MAALLLLTSSAGCRAIRKHVESRQGIAARKLSRQGLEAMHEGRWNAAEELFSGALELSKLDDRAQWGMAESLWTRGEQLDAIEHMEQAVRLSGSDPQLVVRLGRMYYEVGRFEDAAQQSEEALVSGRSLPEAWRLRGDILGKRGADDAALAAYHRALALQADYPEVQVAIADVYHRQRRYDRLLATLDRLRDNVTADASPIRAEMLRGIAMGELGRPREAAQCFAAIAERSPGDVEILLKLAEAEYQAGDLAAARHALDRVLQLDSEHSEGLALAARINDPQQRLARELEKPTSNH
ncbi:tetratricopeptide repeat protein [Candidatus Laterigemmans baculatus]|uniref:tetratricopeptide repeat protein n=1 Tax=Candidatus Laterigemmans baculatus TaxID=2770505 RepID=UPI0013D9A559|nr:tetratricopeptide repeat protein [Candidatus Laterigemmans baculatus]